MPFVKIAELRKLQAIEAEYNKGVGARDFSELKQAIKDNAQKVDSGAIGQAILHQVCIPYDCRKDAFVMETGATIRVQPFELTDSTYKVVDREMLARILRETEVDAVKWRAEEEDCEDIARRFVQRCVDLGINSVGRVLSVKGKHAFCVAIIADGHDLEVVFLEPQTDEIVNPKPNSKYDLTNAFMVIA